MKTFKEFQFGTIVFAFGVPIQIFLVSTYLLHLGNNPMTLGVLLIANSTIVMLYILFYGMKTTIGNGRITITYGIGLIRKTISVRDVKAISIVSNPWYYGWGIRFIPNGMLYNIAGSAGIELELFSSSRVIRIGSQNIPALRDAIVKN